MRHFRPKDLHARLNEDPASPILLDVREAWEFDICHIANSRLVPMRQVPDVIEELDKDAEIVVICHHGIRSRHIARYLESVGFTDLINLEGGVQAWHDEVDPDMPTY